MKMMIVLSALLGANMAFAGNDSIKICNPKNPTQQTVEISVVGKEMKMVSTDGAKVETQTLPVRQTLEATPEDLRVVASQSKLQAILVSGTAYALADDAILIATDSKDVKYAFQVLGPYTQLMGSSASCK